MSERIHSRIAGTGSYLPEKVVTNDDLSKVVDTSDEWIRTRTGIRQRHVAADGQTSSDMGHQAALKAIERLTGKRTPLPPLSEQWPAQDRTRTPNARP